MSYEFLSQIRTTRKSRFVQTGLHTHRYRHWRSRSWNRSSGERANLYSFIGHDLKLRCPNFIHLFQNPNSCKLAYNRKKIPFSHFPISPVFTAWTILILNFPSASSSFSELSKAWKKLSRIKVVWNRIASRNGFLWLDNRSEKRLQLKNAKNMYAGIEAGYFF
jgi:hypothetical protein